MLSLQTQTSLFARAQWTLGVVTALLVGGFYFCAYRPQTARLADLNSRIARIQGELSGAQGQTRVLPAVAAEVEQLKVQRAKFKGLPKQSDMPQFVRDIGRLAEDAKLKGLDYHEGDAIRGDRLNEMPISFTFEGDFVDIFSFLRNTEKLQRLTRVPALSLKAGTDKQGRVKAQMTMNIYYLAE